MQIREINFKRKAKNKKEPLQTYLSVEGYANYFTILVTLWGWPREFLVQDRTGMLWRDPGAMYTLLFLKQATQAFSLPLESGKILGNENADHVVFPPPCCNFQPFLFVALRMIKHYNFTWQCIFHHPAPAQLTSFN